MSCNNSHIIITKLDQLNSAIMSNKWNKIILLFVILALLHLILDTTPSISSDYKSLLFALDGIITLIFIIDFCLPDVYKNNIGIKQSIRRVFGYVNNNKTESVVYVLSKMVITDFVESERLATQKCTTGPFNGLAPAFLGVPYIAA